MFTTYEYCRRQDAGVPSPRSIERVSGSPIALKNIFKKNLNNTFTALSGWIFVCTSMSLPDYRQKSCRSINFSYTLFNYFLFFIFANTLCFLLSYYSMLIVTWDCLQFYFSKFVSLANLVKIKVEKKKDIYSATPFRHKSTHTL